jgi:tetratricopeptide (TPR) repeat protein
MKDFDYKKSCPDIEGLGPYPLFTRRLSDENVEETNFGELIHKGSVRMNNRAGRIIADGSNDVHVAKKILEKALEKDPQYSSAHHNLALIYENSVGDLEKACLHYKQAIRHRGRTFPAAVAGFQRTYVALQKRKKELFQETFDC